MSAATVINDGISFHDAADAIYIINIYTEHSLFMISCIVLTDEMF